MSRRHNANRNLFLSEESEWNGLPVQTCRGMLIDNYLKRINEVIENATTAHPRTCAFRCDLRFPIDMIQSDTSVISRFFLSLKAQLIADEQRKTKEGRRFHRSELRYIWVKERDGSNHWHYHVCLFVNRDAYFTLGRFRPSARYDNDDLDGLFTKIRDRTERKNMVDRIRKAWVSALRLSDEKMGRLVHFPDNATYHLDINAVDFRTKYESLFYRLSYFAKRDTKHYGDGTNNFGSSRN